MRTNYTLRLHLLFPVFLTLPLFSFSLSFFPLSRVTVKLIYATTLREIVLKRKAEVAAVRGREEAKKPIECSKWQLAASCRLQVATASLRILVVSLGERGKCQWQRTVAFSFVLFLYIFDLHLLFPNRQLQWLFKSDIDGTTGLYLVGKGSS